MNFNMTDKTKKILLGSSAGILVFLGGFGGGYAAGQNQNIQGTSKKDRREMMKDETFGGVEEDLDPDFFYDGEDGEEFFMERGPQGRIGGRWSEEDLEEFFGFDDMDREDFPEFPHRKSRMNNSEDSQSGATDETEENNSDKSDSQKSSSNQEKQKSGSSDEKTDSSSSLKTGRDGKNEQKSV